MKFSKSVLFLSLSSFALYSAELELTEPGYAPSIKVTDHILLSSQTVEATPGTNENALLNEIFVDGSYRVYDLTVQLSNKLLESGTESRPLNFEKASARARWESVTLQLGDSYQDFGRGLMLSLYKDDAFGVNTTLQGASAQYHSDFGKLQIVAGRVNELKNPVALNPTPSVVGLNRTVWVIGTDAQTKLGDTTTVGATYVGAMEQDNTTNMFSRRWNQFGVALEQTAIIEDLDFSSNASLMSYEIRSFRGAYVRQPLGLSAFAALTYAPGPIVLKWEVKENQDYDFDLRRPPTLEHDLVSTLHNNNTAATKVSAKYRHEDSQTEFSGSYLLGWDREEEAPIHHLVIGTKFPAIAGMSVETGFRELPLRSKMAHATTKFKFKTTGSHYFEISGTKQVEHTGLNFFPMKKDRNKVDLSYSFSPKFSIGVGYEFVPTEINTQNFVNLQASFQIGDLKNRALVGQTSGGTQCSGGVCREIPPFSGAMFESTILF